MFLFESIPWYAWGAWVLVLGSLILLNEVARANKWLSVLSFIVLPIVLTIFVWPNTADASSSVGTWFHWAKVYSALAGCLGFLAIRHLNLKKGWLVFPAAILAINIMEAVVRDFQCYGLNGFVDGITIIGGPWNIMNGVAGILNILTISGWLGIVITKDKKRDMVWPDMLWFWIVAYDLWNFAYVYNCVSDHAFYAGAALLLSCTIPAFFIKKGAWLQHRAQTLAFWMMFVMSYPSFVDTSKYAIQSSHNETALFLVSLVALLFNIGVFIYHFGKIIKYKRNPLKENVHPEFY